MPSKLRRAISAVKDQTSIGLAVVTRSSDLDVAVLKATTHDDLPSEDRHINEVLILSSSSPHSSASLVLALSRRISRTSSWVVAVKSLYLAHRALRDGGPHFPREAHAAARRGARLFDLSAFRDESTKSSPWDYTAFVRTLALYLDNRLDSFILGKLHRRHGGTANATTVSNMKPPMILERIGHWQRLLDRAIGTRPTGPAKNPRIVKIALYAVVRESFDLYRDVSDGLSMLLDSFFHLPYSACVQTFQSCTRAANQFDQLDGFYTDCKSIGVGRTSEYPSVQKISSVLLGTLHDFLNDNQPAKSPSTHLLTWRMSDDVSSQASRVTQPLTDWESVASDQNWPTVSRQAEPPPPPTISDRRRKGSSTSSLEGWELVLVETASKSSTSSVASTSYRIPHNYSNPFLHDMDDRSSVVLPLPPSTVPHPTFVAAEQRRLLPAPGMAQMTSLPPPVQQQNQSLPMSSLQTAVSNLEMKLKQKERTAPSPLLKTVSLDERAVAAARSALPTFRVGKPIMMPLPTFRVNFDDERPTPAPTFRATFEGEAPTMMQSPTFKAAKFEGEAPALMPSPTFKASRSESVAPKEKDPFDEPLSVLTGSGALVEYSGEWTREQQMWIQQQSKIIAKNMA